MRRVMNPVSMARAITCDRARPASPAAMLWRRLACTRERYRKNILATLNRNRVSGRTAKMTCGGATSSGISTIAADQAIAARLKARLKPSASHGNQPAMKW